MKALDSPESDQFMSRNTIHHVNGHVSLLSPCLPSCFFWGGSLDYPRNQGSQECITWLRGDFIRVGEGPSTSRKTVMSLSLSRED
jgi:hypothetical protein